MSRAAFASLALTLLVSGCASRAVEEIGVPPHMSEVGAGLGGSEMFLTTPPEKPWPKYYSLWSDKQGRFFTDARALSVGDILTVHISINDRARFKNESERNRKAKRNLGFGASFGWDGFSTSGALDADVSSETDTAGSGATTRSENIDLQVAAVVTHVLPNGNLVIRGSQEVRVNAELRVLTIGGIARPQDIGPANTISYERIAESRISYGGRGRLTEVQQPPYGQQLLDHVLPF